MRNIQIVHIIDDDASVRETIALLLNSEGLETRTYASAMGFLATIKWNAKGCVSSDMDMPGMNGLELLTQLVKRHAAPPVIMISGGGNPQLDGLARSKGAVNFLKKPISAETLIFAVVEALTPGNGHADLAAPQLYDKMEEALMKCKTNYYC
jgi:FixJ family two-component response regulator